MIPISPADKKPTVPQPKPAEPARTADGPKGHSTQSAFQANAAAVVSLDGGSSPAGTKPSEDPKNADVTAGMRESELDAYNALSDEERARYNELHREATRTQGSPWDKLRAINQTRQLLRDGQVDEYLATEQALRESGRGEQADQLENLLFQGTLLRKGRGADGNLLQELAPLARGGTTGEPRNVDRLDLLGEIVQDVSDPASIQQGDGGARGRDCGASGMAADMAADNPAKYAHVLTELAEKGEVTLKDRGGEETTYKYEGAEGDDQDLSSTQQIFAEAFGESVDDNDGGGFFGNIVDAIQGLFDDLNGMTAQEVAQKRSDLDGYAQFQTQFIPDAEEAGGNQDLIDAAKADAEKTIREQLAAGETPIVNLRAEDGGMGHWVVVTGTEERDGKTYVRFIDGSGEEQEMAMDEFMDRADSVVYDPAKSHEVPSDFQNTAWDDPGGDRGVRTDPPTGP